MRQQTKITDFDVERTWGIVDEVQQRTGYIYCPKELAEIIQYAIRKCELNGKDEEYFYLLLPDELEQYLMRAYINMRGEENRRRRLQDVRDLQTVAVQPTMPQCT